MIMAKSLIPTRPDPDKHLIPAADKDLISYAVAMGIPNDVAFLRFHPEFAGPDGGLTVQGRKRSKDFWQYAKNRNFKDDYAKYLKEWASGKGGDTTAEDIDEISEEKKRATITRMLNQLVKLIGNGDVTGDDLKTYSEIMKKVGWLKDEVEQITPPIRVLMTRCSECRYRVCVESAVSNGEILDMCAYCRARTVAEEHGFRFNDGKNLLDIPKEVIEDLERKNNVKLEDILSGKVEN